MNKIITRVVVIFLFAFIGFACSKETEKKEVITPEIVLQATGPFFEGPNDANGTWDFDLDTFFGEEGIAREIDEARITSISIKMVGSDEYPEMKNMKLEVVSPNTQMQTVGNYLGEVRSGERFELKVADGQDKLVRKFNDSRMTFVATFDVEDEEYYDDIEFIVQVTFELDVVK
ncbi:MAG: hypothetical protein LAT68_05605 [Cyclobacteriaceae bacterium]|nr:hypothetical protein [Cyclobacteriaceae bacterium]MCH8515787.1 hypothetical protein [Cyclobacteriaceae bacterium]